MAHPAPSSSIAYKWTIANEQECITRITNEVATRINQEPLHVTNYPVGLVPRVKEVISYLDLWSTEKIKMIGICGAGGIGKTTIARALYNSIADNFEGLCFLSNVRKRSKEPNGLSHLQETLLYKLVMAKDLNFGDYHEGIHIIQRRLSQKKILLILDDVDESDQLEALVGRRDWFGCGSRIIITTRNKQLLKSHGVESIYDVKELNSEESLKLLSWYAFKEENVDSNYMEVCNRAIHYSCGFPLVLEVIGSNLYGKEVSQWSSALDQFKSMPDRTILNALKWSFDTLQEVEKQVFLDLACFFNGEKSTHFNDMLRCIHGIHLEYAIGTLVDKSLIKIEENGITMHGLIENLGKEIVRQESSYEPGKRSRLWYYKDILHVLQEDTGTNKVEAIILDLPEGIEVQWSAEAFMKMKSLKILMIRKACFSECPKYLPNSLKWLEWSFALDLAKFDQWVKTERIGAGGFGIVHVGFNSITGEKCAIKEMLHIDNLQTAHSVNQEVHMLSRLEHPNIVKYYGSKIVNCQVSIYMEYIESGSLGEYIKSRKALQESLVRYFTAKILSALDYLHSERVVHRDIKPDNILLDYENNVKLADFGLAKHLAQSAGKHSVDGTIRYAAPELIRRGAYKSSGEAYGVDIWGLGCVIIAMLTGKHPWPDCTNPYQVMVKVCRKNQDPEIPKNVSLACKDFLERCFIRDPAKRPSAAELLNHPFVTTQTQPPLKKHRGGTNKEYNYGTL